ncbi:MAG: ISL3 family transposase [Mobiluncus porci]|uniref:ISL3 family transposase n=1 Tax=Mobiluncus porci TaxID=2652278 RepID=UPI0023F4E0EC|nr:ISL3 family transposase [Mobiluncus porci]MDD7541731.1 ISL3 family transposase [Mobiluncus porci]MDY5747765.1 ISL3 family transposase [Mobiluncus porci]
MSDCIFSCPDLDSFCLLDRLGLRVEAQSVGPDRAVLACRLYRAESWCESCGASGVPRGTVGREWVHSPYGSRPTILQVRIPRWACESCGRVWRQDSSRIAAPKRRLTVLAAWHALKLVVVDHMSIKSVAQTLGASWHATFQAVHDLGWDQYLSDPTRFDGVEVIGVDEHKWAHTTGVEQFVTVVIDLTPVRKRTGPARLLDMIPGHSKKVFKAWLAARPESFRNSVEIVSMDGFTGYKTAVVEELPDAITVMDPFHVIALAGTALDQCRQRIQQATLGRRGKTGDPLYGARKTLRAGQGYLTKRQWDKLEDLFADENHVCVEVTWHYYQQMITAYREDNRKTGEQIMQHVINDLAQGVPDGLTELRRLGATLKRRAGDILAYFKHPHSSNGPTEAINGHLEHLRGIALGFRNLPNYITRSLLETGGLKPQLKHP